jgi:hypothetical protein
MATRFSVPVNIEIEADDEDQARTDASNLMRTANSVFYAVGHQTFFYILGTPREMGGVVGTVPQSGLCDCITCKEAPERR